MKRRTKKGGRKSKRPNKEMFETLYYNDEVTASELAKLYNVAESTIYNWAFQFRNESNLSDSENNLTDKQIYNRPITINYNKKKERSKIS